MARGEGPCIRCGANDWIYPKGGNPVRRCQACRRAKTTSGLQLPDKFRNEGMGPEYTARLKALYDESTDEQWDSILNAIIGLNVDGWVPPDRYTPDDDPADATTVEGSDRNTEGGDGR